MIIVLLFIHRETDMRNSILAQVLDQSARARCKWAFRFIVWLLKGIPLEVNNAVVEPKGVKYEKTVMQNLVK